MAAALLGWMVSTALAADKPGEKPGEKAGAKPGGADKAVAVELAAVRAEAALEVVQALGNLRAAQTTMLRPEVAGRIVRLPVADGQRVARGQLLVQLDDAVQRAQAQQASAQADTAASNLKRARELQAQGFVSDSAVEQAEGQLKVAQAQLALARAQVQRLQVRAPFAGVLGIRQVSLGDYLKEGAELFTLEDSSRLWADFRVPEQMAGRVRAGQALSLSVDALGGQRLNGVVEAVDSQADANGRALLVRARLTQTAPGLRSGLFVRVSLELGRREQATWVPEEALVPQGGKVFVFRVQGGVAEKLAVQTGARKPGWVELLGGVAAGDQVVAAGQQRLRGDKVPVRAVELERLGVTQSPTPTPAPASAAKSK
jgi:membrane fusion protein (multidrug efflux system)